MKGRLVVPGLAVALVLAAAELAVGAFTAHRSNPQDFVAAPGPSPPGRSLLLQSRTNDGGATSSQIQLGLNLRNTGEENVPLGTVTVRYWFTSNGATDLVAACYYATFGCGNANLGLTRLSPAREGATHYLEVSYPGGTLAPGKNAMLDQLAVRDQRGTTMSQTDDHSFLNAGTFTDNPAVTAYLGGTLVWGTEPGDQPVTQTVELQYADLDGNPSDALVRPGLIVQNTGTGDIDLTSLTLRYWFTKDSGKPEFQGFCDYAQLGCPSVRIGFEDVRPKRPMADTYLEVGFNDGTLGAGESTGQVQLRFNKTSFSVLDETNDYSHAANTAFARTVTVTAYLDGTLIWGTEP